MEKRLAARPTISPKRKRESSSISVMDADGPKGEEDEEMIMSTGRAPATDHAKSSTSPTSSTHSAHALMRIVPFITPDVAKGKAVAHQPTLSQIKETPAPSAAAEEEDMKEHDTGIREDEAMKEDESSEEEPVKRTKRKAAALPREADTQEMNKEAFDRIVNVSKDDTVIAPTLVGTMVEEGTDQIANHQDWVICTRTSRDLDEDSKENVFDVPQEESESKPKKAKTAKKEDAKVTRKEEVKPTRKEETRKKTKSPEEVKKSAKKEEEEVRRSRSSTPNVTAQTAAKKSAAASTKGTKTLVSFTGSTDAHLMDQKVP